jgi:hypothetical protein
MKKLERTRRIEAFKQKTNGKLAEAHQQASLTNLEAQLQEQIG